MRNAFSEIITKLKLVSDFFPQMSQQSIRSPLNKKQNMNTSLQDQEGL